MNKVVVVGLGSMGRRRIRLLQKLEAPPYIVGVDRSVDRLNQARKEYGIDVMESLEEAIGAHRPNAVLVCTSPAGHGPIVMQCLEAGLDVFMEINLIGDWYGDAEALAAKKGRKLFLSSTFLYHPQLNYIAEAVKGEKVDYIYHSGQYLPDWHPWEDYRNFFVSERRTNACREILAIEFPWMIKAFGKVESFQVMKDRNSSLDVDFPDNFMISLKHENGNKGIFCQDVISRKGMRQLEIYSENIHIFWDGRKNNLSRYDLERKAVCHVELQDYAVGCAEPDIGYLENVYWDETRSFVDFLSGDVAPRHSLADDRYVLDLIDSIEA